MRIQEQRIQRNNIQVDDIEEDENEMWADTKAKRKSFYTTSLRLGIMFISREFTKYLEREESMMTSKKNSKNCY